MEIFSQIPPEKEGEIEEIEEEEVGEETEHK